MRVAEGCAKKQRQRKAKREHAFIAERRALGVRGCGALVDIMAGRARLAGPQGIGGWGRIGQA